MAFVWTNNPNLPIIAPPVVIGPIEVSTEVNVVANTVNVSPLLCTVSYNTHNIGYDVICVLPSLNVKDLHVTHLEADNVTVFFKATINTANIGASTINTANIVNATIANGRMGVNPTANLQIATKGYVDSLIANSSPTGGNLQLLIIASGDLLVGVSDNTAERLPIGSEKQVLMAGSTSGNTGIHWVGPIGSSSSHRGLTLGTHWSGNLMNTTIVLATVDEIVMDDGERVATGWNGLTAKITSNVSISGVGYLDTGVVQPNSAYELYAIRNSSNGAQGLLLHRTKDTQVDTHYSPVSSTTQRFLRANNPGGSNCTSIAARFSAHSNGPIVGVDLQLSRTGSPVGNVWVTIQTNAANNNVSGTILCTSRKFSAGWIGAANGDLPRIRFPFDVSSNVVNGTVYWAVLEGDYAISTYPRQDYVSAIGDTAASGSPYVDGPSKFFNVTTNGWALANSTQVSDAQQALTGPSNLYLRTFVEANDSAVVMPSGYDQRALISYCSTTKLSFLREYHQRGYKMSMAQHYTWCYDNNGGQIAASGNDLSTANNSKTIAFPDVRHMGVFVPPVPCFVWLYRYSGLSTSAMLAVGSLTATNLPVQIFSEQHNTLSLTNAATGFPVYGPFMVEFNAHMTHSGGPTFGQQEIAAIEF